MSQARIKLLCVDDEPQVLEGLGLHLRRRYDMQTATNGLAALDLLRADPSIAVVISDMRMPQMNGATFLAKARELAPDTVRMLLTGQTDLDSAVAAVNEGQIFRFLTKPASPATMQRAVEAAIEQHRLLTAERVLLEQTLIGCTKTLADVLALTNPSAFGRSTRIKTLVLALAAQLHLTQSWQLELAAMFSQLGSVSLPQETLDRLYRGESPSAEERAMIARSYALSDQLLGNIPRLEGVRAIISAFAKQATGPWRAVAGAANDEPRTIQRGADLLRLAVDFDTLEAQGNAPVLVFDMLRAQAERYDPALLDALGVLRGGSSDEVIREVAISGLRVGMVFVDDVKLKNGMLLVVRGYEVTNSFIERVRNQASNVKEPLRVMGRASAAPAHA